MTGSSSRVFDFNRRLADHDRHIALVKEYAAAAPLRSAAVEELELEEDSYRRPVRPEDLSFIDLSRPVSAATVTRLPFFASQRLLFAINEQRSVRLPAEHGLDRYREFMEFHAERSRETGQQIAPFLEDFAFSFLEPDDSASPAAGDVVEQFGRHLDLSSEFADATLGQLSDRHYLQEGLCFLLMQEWSLLLPKRVALQMATAAGFFDFLATPQQVGLDCDDNTDGLLAELADRCGITRRAHSYWQFYLSSSLARCNLLYALATRPVCAFRLIGAAYVAMADWLVFTSTVSRGAELIGISLERRPKEDGDGGAALLSRFRSVIATVEQRWGADAVREVAAGVAMAKSLAECARQDLGDQLNWLSSLDRYREYAHLIDRRIAQEAPDIDRETFVEPREMCSTTHVHDDHRLVVIESGNMVFWGNLGMTLRLKPGEMVLVPQGRLHGSSIESDECVYHQPIISDDWIDAVLRQAEIEPVH
jgi:hypothetical protein